MFMAAGLVLLIFILPALAISWVVPGQQLSLTAGVMQAFSSLLRPLRVGAARARANRVDQRHGDRR